MFFESWSSLLQIVVVGVLAYAGLVSLLRISGKRTLSKMNAFDLVVTVALGSILGSTVLMRDVPLLDGLVAFAVLILLQFVVTWAQVRSETVQRMIKATPRLLYYHGDFLDAAMRRERVSREEVEAAVRNQGLASVRAAEAVVLETDGTITALGEPAGGAEPALRHVRGPADGDLAAD